MKHKQLERFKAFRKTLLLPVGTLLILGLIYPGGPILSLWSDVEKLDQIATCTLLPPKVVGLLFFSLIAIVAVASLFQLLINSAIYSMLSGIIAATVVGVWFLVASLGYAYCWPLPEANLVFSILIPLVLIFCAVIYYIFVRTRMVIVLQFNSYKWDFNKMKYSILAPVLRSDGVSNIKFTSLVSSAGLTGILLGKYLTPNNDMWADWLGVLALFLVGCYFLGVLVVGEVYLTWLIYKKSKLIGRKMTIMEFSRKPRGN